MEVTKDKTLGKKGLRSIVNSSCAAFLLQPSWLSVEEGRGWGLLPSAPSQEQGLPSPDAGGERTSALLLL